MGQDICKGLEKCHYGSCITAIGFGGYLAKGSMAGKELYGMILLVIATSTFVHVVLSSVSESFVMEGVGCTKAWDGLGLYMIHVYTLHIAAAGDSKNNQLNQTHVFSEDSTRIQNPKLEAKTHNGKASQPEPQRHKL